MLLWSDELEIGIDLIDKQHKAIFQKAEEIFAMDQETDFEKIEKAISYLMGYTTSHFYEEEQLMLEYQYEKFVEHRNEHNHYVEEIYKIYLKTRDRIVTEEILADLKVFICQWLTNHIKKTDRELIEIIRSKNLTY